MLFLKRFIFILSIAIFGFLTDNVQAQPGARTHFIYIRSDNQQPYYVILNNKSYSSSSVGYLNISKLPDGMYKMTIGFPQNVYPASTYLLKVSGTDAGFLLKKGSGDTWDLIDKLSQKALPVTQADTDMSASSNNTGDDTGNGKGFSDLLSKTSNDTTNYRAYATPDRNTSNGSGGTDANGGKPVDRSNDGSSESYDAAAARSAVQSIVKIGEYDNRRGVFLAFVVTATGKTDTVNAFFPGDRNKSILSEDTAVADNRNTAPISPEKAALKKEVDSRKTTDNPFYKSATAATKNNTNLSLYADTSDNGLADTKKANTVKENNGASGSQNPDSREIFNSTCSSMISDKDLGKIRKKMISKSTDEDMIAVARKYIDTKCIYTSQIKELGGLLISDNGRFALYRILYPNVYDASQFNTLENQLLDKNYKAQFDTFISNGR